MKPHTDSTIPVRKRASPDKTSSKLWRDAQTTRLLGFEVLRRSLSGLPDKMGSRDIADMTASGEREAGRIFNRKFIPALLAKLGREPTRKNRTAIRKFFDETNY